jgi:leader peptidase (prepilin peptidase) / N-methyltransferase
MIVFTLLLVTIGLAIGSFLGACVYRVPRGISIVNRGSFCPACNSHLRWRDLVPIVSPILNGWKCRECNAKIPFTYTAIEVVTATVLTVVVFCSEWDCELPGRMTVVLTLIPIIWIDWEFLVIPNSILTIGAIAFLSTDLALAPSFVLPRLGSAAAAIALMMVIRVVGSRLLKKPALGMGDVKLGGFIALQLGLVGLLCSLWLGAVGALTYASLFKARASAKPLGLTTGGSIRLAGEAIPFGTFLSAASIVILLTFDTVQTLIGGWLISIL